MGTQRTQYAVHSCGHLESWPFRDDHFDLRSDRFAYGCAKGLVVTDFENGLNARSEVVPVRGKYGGVDTNRRLSEWALGVDTEAVVEAEVS